MSPARAFWLRVNRRAATLRPEVAREFMRAIERLRQSLTEAELTRLIERGGASAVIDRLLNEAALKVTFAPYQNVVHNIARESVPYFARDLPIRDRSKIVSVQFNVLSPRDIAAIRELDTKVMQTLRSDVREVTRAFIENGLRDGVNPREVARNLRSVIGLSPTQEQYIRNYRAELENAHTAAADALSRELRDRRLDPMIRRARESGVPLTPEQIEKAVGRYNQRFIAKNAETHARTATLDAMKRGQQAAWESAREQGLITGPMMKEWVSVLDDRVREEHQDMHGEVVAFDQPFSNGEVVPGESTYNCRCVTRVFVGREAKVDRQPALVGANG